MKMVDGEKSGYMKKTSTKANSGEYHKKIRHK